MSLFLKIHIYIYIALKLKSKYLIKIRTRLHTLVHIKTCNYFCNLRCLFFKHIRNVLIRMLMRI